MAYQKPKIYPKKGIFEDSPYKRQISSLDYFTYSNRKKGESDAEYMVRLKDYCAGQIGLIEKIHDELANKKLRELLDISSIKELEAYVKELTNEIRKYISTNPDILKNSRIKNHISKLEEIL
ncbi:MAG: hypothetical protein N3D20_01040 [Candidatus Pacearchaeota archaeon]|nr:hypothetical protein [Candidatus Pacearchaeota archaeon]